MNVIVANSQQNLLATLDIDIIKSITGVYEANEVVTMFKDFFFNKMILDVTALNNYEKIETFQTLAMGLDIDKIIFFLPENSSLCTVNFLSKLVSVGIYNFTSNVKGVEYLLRHSNTYKDVAHFQQLNETQMPVASQNPQSLGNLFVPNQPYISNVSVIFGVRNVTEHAGATTLIYMMKNELASILGNRVVAIEVDKNDFKVFNDRDMVSTSKQELRNVIQRYKEASVILVDLNSTIDDAYCHDIIYLIEPSIIKLNKLIRRNSTIFNKLKGKKIVLNKSLLSNKDVGDFEYESKSKIFYNLPPLDERKKNSIIHDFLVRLGLLSSDQSKKEDNKVFGLFRK